LESGAAIKVNNIGTLPYKIGALLANPTRLAQLKANVARIARPRAAFDVVEQSLKLMNQK
jgi:processive 1,2-diacylglycerol beta-glucosyltransferase